MNERGGDANGRGAVPEKTSEPPPSKVEALDGSNYEEWSGRMRSAFKRYKLLKIAVGEEKMPEEGEERERWIEKSAVLFDLILQSVNKEMFEHIKDLVEADDSGPRAWKLLRDVIQPNTLPMVIVLEKELAAISMRPGDDVKPVLDKIKDTYARMAAAGSSVSQLQQCTKIISVLDNSWDNLIPTLNSQQDQWTPEWLRQQILQEDFRRRHKSKAEVTFGPTSCRAKLGKKVLWSLEEETSCIKDLWQLPIIPWNGKTPTTATAATAKATAGGDATAPTDGVLEAVKKKLVKDGSLKGLEVKVGVKEIGSCPTCLETKFSKFPFNSTTGPAKTPLALVHMDVVGPTRAPSLSGSRYFLTIVDDHTRAVWVYPLKSKGEVAAAVLKEWMPRARRECGHKVKVALVKNRVLATIGDKEWIPYVKWYGSAPAVNMLRAFRCMVVFHVPKEKRGKFEASGRWGVHLGIAKDHKGWLLWDLTTQKLTVSRDVKFLESLYYKEWKQQQQKLPSTPLIVEVDEVQRPSRQVEVAVSEEEMSGVTEEGGAAEVEQQQQQQHESPPRVPHPPERPRRDVRPPEVVWLRRLLEELGVGQKEPTVIFCDNESAVKLAKNACLHGLTKHIRPKWHWVRRLLDKEVRLEIVKTHQQAADIFTKRLAEADHWKGMKLAGMSVH
ncbi:hypothetical protein CLOM_g18808 [Closterium sp. NIES-68]|nr:hypothetical protein CLOM_g18808 [Closterium sp. NIES-68]